jgi:hypothetical protein
MTRSKTAMTAMFAFGLVGSLAGCASTGEMPAAPKSANLIAAEQAAELDSDACLRASSIHGYNVIDDRHLIMDGPGTQRKFLITTATRCWDMDWSYQLAVKSRVPNTCLSSFDQIKTREDSCFIDSVERVKDLETAKALVAARAADKADHKAQKDKAAATEATTD